MSIFNKSLGLEDDNSVCLDDGIDLSEIAHPEEINDSNLGEDTSIELATQVMDNQFNEVQETSSAMESLFCLEALRESSSLGLEAAGVLEFSFAQQFGRLGFENDHAARVELGLESFARDSFNAVAQAWVLNGKISMDVQADFFRSTRANVERYDAILRRALAEYNSKRGRFTNEEHRVNLAKLWYFFTTDGGMPKDLLRELVNDVTASKYLLETYPKEVVEQLKKGIALLRSGSLKSKDDLSKLAEAFGKLKSGYDLFDEKYLHGKPLFGVNGFEAKMGSRRNTIKFNGKDFSDLADNATPKAYSFHSDFSHNFKKFASSAFGINGGDVDAAGQWYEYKDDQISKVIDFGQKYIENVRSFMGMEQEFKKLDKEMGQAVERLLGTMGDDFSGERNQAKALIKQIQQTMDNLIYCVRQPASAEVARSIRGARYSGYLALRMIYNASKFYDL